MLLDLLRTRLASTDNTQKVITLTMFTLKIINLTKVGWYLNVT